MAVWWLVVILAEATAMNAAEIPARSVPADGRIILQDCGARDWGPELVHFQVDTGRFVPGIDGMLPERNR
jgi:hypothetical protein